MGKRLQAGIEVEESEYNQMTEFAKRNRASADFVSAISLARKAQTETGLDADADESGGSAKLTVQQGLKAAYHAREDGAATLMLQHRQLERLDSLRNLTKWIIALLAILIVRSFR